MKKTKKKTKKQKSKKVVRIINLYVDGVVGKENKGAARGITLQKIM